MICLLLTPWIGYPNIKLDERNSVVNVGTATRPTYLPAEVCTVLPGQTLKRRLSPDQTARMILFACRKPWENANSIIGDGKEMLGFKASSNPFLVSLVHGTPLTKKLTCVRRQWVFELAKV
jgi:eukaryotic translation initiation factor 2C